MGVSNGPGQMAFTVMPFVANSSACVFVRSTMAPLVAGTRVSLPGQRVRESRINE